MEKWKSVAIMALLGMMIGYGAFQAKKAAAPPPPIPASDDKPPPAKSLEGKPATTWAVPANNWANTKKPIDLADLKGSVALIEFFRIGCPHCERAAPVLEKMYQKLAPRGLKMVAFHSPASPAPPSAPAAAIAMSKKESSWPQVQATLKTWGTTYPVAFDAGATVFKSSYQGTTFPTFFVLNRNGVITNVIFGDQKLDELQAAIEAQLAKK